MSLPPAVWFVEFCFFFLFPLLVCVRQYWQPYLSSHSCWVVPSELQYWIKASEEKKNNTQPNHCQEIGVIVSSLVSNFHLRNMVRTGFADSTRTICHLRHCFWEISFSRVSLAPGFIIWLMLILISVIFVTLAFILFFSSSAAFLSYFCSFFLFPIRPC